MYYFISEQKELLYGRRKGNHYIKHIKLILIRCVKGVKHLHYIFPK